MKPDGVQSCILFMWVHTDECVFTDLVRRSIKGLSKLTPRVGFILCILGSTYLYVYRIASLALQDACMMAQFWCQSSVL